MSPQKKKVFAVNVLEEKNPIPPPRVPQELFLDNFIVNFLGSTVWKVLLFVHASAFYNKAVYQRKINGPKNIGQWLKAFSRR